MAMAEQAPREGTEPADSKRVELRVAIRARKSANSRYEFLETAVQLAHEVCRSGHQLFDSLCDVDAAIVQYRAEEFKRVATGGSLAGTGLPENLEARRTMRDVAAEQLTRARTAYDGLLAEAAEAKAATEQAALDVAKAACAVLLEEGATQGRALQEAWEQLWLQFDRIMAFTHCQIHYAETAFPITLVPETACLLQTLATIDDRRLAHQDDAAKAGEVWCLWFNALLGDAEAQLSFDREPSSISSVHA